MTKLEKENKTTSIMLQIENAYREMGKLLGKLKKTDKVELLIPDTCATYLGYLGYLYPYVDDGKKSDTDFCLETKDGHTIEFSIWALFLNYTFFDSKNNILTLKVKSAKIKSTTHRTSR